MRKRDVTTVHAFTGPARCKCGAIALTQRKARNATQYGG
jgi:hypothetical protein